MLVDGWMGFLFIALCMLHPRRNHLATLSGVKKGYMELFRPDIQWNQNIKANYTYF